MGYGVRSSGGHKSFNLRRLQLKEYLLSRWPILDESESDWKNPVQSIHLIKKLLQWKKLLTQTPKPLAISTHHPSQPVTATKQPPCTRAHVCWPPF
ncbi:hypothetical protein PVL29_005616 [Vitis rotundifolia]|uniref:Uncharacterized protein n=1 Tax=Vitis rotundifolia TaxID=103349 RepID=A0AA39A3M2_VITRO|nr:hypothetical protein PVL29_005616 [Vitis rotundifolia]